MGNGLSSQGSESPHRSPDGLKRPYADVACELRHAHVRFVSDGGGQLAGQARSSLPFPQLSTFGGPVCPSCPEGVSILSRRYGEGVAIQCGEGVARVWQGFGEGVARLWRGHAPSFTVSVSLSDMS